MKKKYRIQIYLLFVWLIFDSCSTQDSADLILIAPAYTMNETQPWTEAVAIKKNKIVFAGIDLIGNYLTGDINITSPTGIKNFKDLTGKDLSVDFWDYLERK